MGLPARPPRGTRASRASRRPGVPGARRGTVVLGVTGLPAGGKSTVTGMLAALGAETVDADALAHRALEEPAVVRAVEALLGIRVRGPGGAVDRGAVAERVFGGRDGSALRRLASLLHPPVRRRMREALAAARRRGAAAVALDVPLLFEAGVDRECDVTVFVDAPRAERLRRARGRGWTDRDLRRREARQWPAPMRRRRADFVVANGGSRSATWKQVRALWARAVAGTAGGGTARRGRGKARRS